MSVTVYRIEHSTKFRANHRNIGFGAYSDFFTNRHEMGSKHTFDTHPSIRKDIDFASEGTCTDEWYSNNEIYEECFCACATLGSLNKWFRGYKTQLLKEDFVVVAYEVKSIIDTVSKKQLMFSVNEVISKKIVQTKLGIVK